MYMYWIVLLHTQVEHTKGYAPNPTIEHSWLAKHQSNGMHLALDQRSK